MKIQNLDKMVKKMHFLSYHKSGGKVILNPSWDSFQEKRDVI